MFIGEDPCGLCGYGKKENVRAYSTIEADSLYAYMLYDESLSYGMKVADMLMHARQVFIGMKMSALMHWINANAAFWCNCMKSNKTDNFFNTIRRNAL